MKNDVFTLFNGGDIVSAKYDASKKLYCCNARADVVIRDTGLYS